MDWEHLFVPGGSPLELMVRGTVLAEGDGSISVIKARRPRARGHGQEAG
ncbi:MAG TPA: hypothetical protein VMN03_13835 [Burkholderiales bacterium]|nr:hypothetical protein [Burkholderiales bacterium]